MGTEVITVRRYDPARDAAALHECVIETQEHHRALEPSWPPGPAMADAYLKFLEGRCASQDGGVLIAERAGEIAGFVCVLAAVPGDAPDDPDSYAWILDLLVRAAHRRRGVARTLMAHAEAFARQRGARVVRLGVLDRNAEARRFYEGAGYRQYVRVLTKPL